MPEIRVAELLALQGALTETVRHEVGLARLEFKEKFDEFSSRHKALEQRQSALEASWARLDERNRLSTKDFFSNLSKKQKAAVSLFATVLGGALLDGAGHIGNLLEKLIHGVRP